MAVVQVEHAAVADFERCSYLVIADAITPELRATVLAAGENMLSSTVTRGRDRGADGKDGFRGCVALAPEAFLPLVANPGSCRSSLHCSVPTSKCCPPTSSRCLRSPSAGGEPSGRRSGQAGIGTCSASPTTSAALPHHAWRSSTRTTSRTRHPNSGVTMFPPGSHRLTAPPPIAPNAVDPPGAVTASVCSAGTDDVLFENRTWHAGGINTSGRPRLAVMIQYGYRWLASVDDPTPELLDRTGLSDVELQLLGAPDRNPDGSLAKGRGGEPLRRWYGQLPDASR